MFKWYKYLIVNLVFSNLVFWSGNRFLIAPFPDRCLLVPFCFLERDAHFVCEVFSLVFSFLIVSFTIYFKVPVLDSSDSELFRRFSVCSRSSI